MTSELGVIVKISGAVDNSRMANILAGWARCRIDDQIYTVTIYAYDAGKIVCRVEANLHRNDNTNCGFVINFRRDLTIDELRSGAIKIFAESHGERAELPLIEPMLVVFEARAVGYKYSRFNDDVIRHLVSGLTMNSTTEYKKNLFKASRQVDEKDRTGLIEGVKNNVGSSFLLPLGLKSRDGTAVIGYDGFIFLLGGTNNILQLYKQKKEDEIVRKTTEKWLNTFRQRKETLQSLGIQFIQINIPDKSSILPELFPIDIDSPTALLASIQELSLEDHVISPSYIDMLGIFLRDEKKRDLFQKTDSHLAPYGCQQVLSAVLRHLNVFGDIDAEFTRKSLKSGDLGEKYLGHPLAEILMSPRDGQFLEYEKGLVREERFIPADGQTGARVRWTNSSAPVNLKVVAFANSFFSHGEDAVGISWWAARYFREFHFIWESNIDYDYVRVIRPDVVIAQTVERFLRRHANF